MKNRIVDYKLIKASELTANPNNWRTHPDGQRKSVAAVLDEVGWVDAVIYNQRTGRLVDGHLRRDIAEDELVPVLVVDLSEEEERKVLATFDPLSAMAGMDAYKLDELLRDLETDNEDLIAMLDDMQSDVNDLLAELNPPAYDDAPEPQIDRAEELLDVWQVERGQIWEIPSQTVAGKCHRVMCGDSTSEDDVKRLLNGISPLYGLHDPPYGINVVSASDSGGSKPYGTVGADGMVKANYYTPVVGDNKSFEPEGVLKWSDYCVLWGANYYADKLPAMKGWLVWDKKGRQDWNDNFSDCELAWSNLPVVTSIVYHTHMGMVQEGTRETRFHPTQKPAAMLVKLMMEHFKDNGSVIDLYMGSGSTIVACEQVGRVGYGMEIESKYVAVTLQRLADMGLEPGLVK